MNFRTVEMPQINKHNLSIYNYHRGILVFLSTLAFFLCSVKHNKAMKIGFIFFQVINLFLYISKVSEHFCSFLKPGKIALHAWLADWAERTEVAPAWNTRGTDWALMWPLLWVYKVDRSGPSVPDLTAEIGRGGFHLRQTHTLAAGRRRTVVTRRNN